MMAFTRRIEEVERKEKPVKALSEAGALSTQLYGRGGHGTEKVDEKRRSRQACDTGGVEEGAAQGPRGEIGGAGGEKLENKRKKETKHTQGIFEGKTRPERVDRRGGCEEENASLVRGSQQSKEAAAWGGSGRVAPAKRFQLS
jgi:hypothetical protein